MPRGLLILKKRETYLDNVKVLVASHKKAEMPSNELYMPILVGSYKNYQEDINYQRDDVGENISEKNPNYNELTAIYWAWKNMGNAEAVGLVHYRRLFVKNKTELLSQEDIEKSFETYDVILPKLRKYYVETNYLHYIHAHNEEPLMMTRRIIEKYHNSYLSSFDTVMNSTSAHMFNMFIMKPKIFNSYCEWLFDILKKLEENIYVEDYSEQESRVFGYVSEVLMDVWIKKNNINYCEHDWMQVNGEKKLTKAMHLILRKFGLSKRTHF
ncbi:DUF4422 domain-containing protein [Companilactobacillus mishanensis]|uniref:DUF4422 domain-containing protein n=1 Tax=Companilactobacillus mishanensis TaxID=2486008 RepID=A0ABW9P8E9_9LACO|nr:DUF4422 domain-containing protein [Companilactobacillus mishanensis]MQS45428.1 DUF4422 domain-containing protein [Companilactobacillus mishanensis]